jgi:hypothetical protein
LPKAETAWRASLKDSDLMAEANDLSLLSSTGPKRGGDQSQNSYQKWTLVETMMISRTERKPAFSIRTRFSVCTDSAGMVRLVALHRLTTEICDFLIDLGGAMR